MADKQQQGHRIATGTTGRIDGNRQDLETGLVYDSDGNVVVPEIEDKTKSGVRVVQVDQIGAFRRVVYSDGSVATVQTEPASQGDGEIVTPVPLPGEQQDVTGTGMDAATKPKVAPGAKTWAAAEKAAGQG